MRKIFTMWFVGVLCGLLCMPVWSQSSSIAFTSTRDGNTEIYVMNGDGSGQTNLTNTPSVSEEQPSWRVDGARLIYSRTGGIWTMKADGSAQSLVINGGGPTNPDFDPTGQKIVYSDTTGGLDYDAFVMAQDGSNPTRITSSSYGDYWTRWSPNGTKISFLNFVPGQILPEIFVINPDGTGLTRLTTSGKNRNPDWSPDGAKIVFQSERDGNSEIYVMNADGTNQTRLTNDPGDDSYPTFSPDGNKIAFASDRDGDYEIYVMNADGSDASTPQRLTNNNADDSAPSWVLSPPSNAPTISINDVTINEGDSGWQNLEFTVSLDNASSEVVTVKYGSNNGSAIAPNDYVSLPSGTLTFSPGQLTQTLAVQVQGDTLDEIDETFTVFIYDATNAKTDDLVGKGTIIDNDAPPILAIADTNQNEGDSGTATVSVPVTLSSASSLPITFNYTTSDGTAIQPGDYSSKTGSVTIPVGSTTALLTFVITGDTVKEADETFLVTLSSPTNATLGDSDAIVKIVNNDPTSLSIEGSSVIEGDSGQANVTFTVTLSDPLANPVTFDFATSNNSATSGSDYVSTSGSRTLQPGDTSLLIIIPVMGDIIDENDETFKVTISNPTNANLGISSALSTIQDDDAPPIVSISDVGNLEGNSGTTNFSFVVSLSSISGKFVTVNYATADGTALQPGDYTARTGTSFIFPGSLSTTVIVAVKTDAIKEVHENFHVVLSAPSNAALGDDTAVGTIINDDLPTIDIADSTTKEDNISGQAASFIVTLSEVYFENVSVDFATVPGTATSGADYTTTSGSITFTPGQTTKRISVPITDDSLDEDSETFFVTLSNPTNAGITNSQGTCIITDNDAKPNLKINDVTVAEGTGSNSDALLTITLSKASGRIVTVNYATANGSAVQPSDYNATNGILTFSPGQTSKSVAVVLIGDSADEGNETFNISLAGATNANIADNLGQVVITDDDILPSLSIGDASPIIEDGSGAHNSLYQVTLNGATNRSVKVEYATTNGGSATAGVDFTPTNGLLTFTPGQTSKTIVVPVLADNIEESNETIRLIIKNPTFANISDNLGQGVIFDNDHTLSINDVNQYEGNAGTTNFVFTVRLSMANSEVVTVGYQVVNGTAIKPGDYLGQSGTLTFAPSEISKTITVAVNGDMTSESDETFFVNLSSPSGATITDGQGQGIILSDDNSG